MSNTFIQLRYNIPSHFVMLFCAWMPDNRISIRIRGFLLSFFIRKCGKNFTIGRDVTLLNTYNLEIGDNVYIAKGCWLNSMAGLVIEKEVVFGPYVVISTMQHVFKNKSVRFGGSLPGKVTIGYGSWLASHCSIKNGVKIGIGNLIAANSFVSNDTYDYGIYGGVPAKFIKHVSDGKAEVFGRNDLL